MIMKRLLAMTLAVVITFTGCSSNKYIYREIEKDKDVYNERAFTTTPLQLQQAVTEMLLSKKFVIDNNDPITMTVSARRFFSRSRESIVVVVQAKIIPVDDMVQKLYLNAVQTTERNYVADRTRFLLWVVPLPGGGGKVVSNTKESEMVIEDKDFYRDLFDEIQKKISHLFLVKIGDSALFLN